MGWSGTVAALVPSPVESNEGVGHPAAVVKGCTTPALIRRCAGPCRRHAGRRRTTLNDMRRPPPSSYLVPSSKPEVDGTPSWSCVRGTRPLGSRDARVCAPRPGYFQRHTAHSTEKSRRFVPRLVRLATPSHFNLCARVLRRTVAQFRCNERGTST